MVVNKLKHEEEWLQEIKALRAVLERILRVMDEGLFVDYQLEKFSFYKKEKGRNC